MPSDSPVMVPAQCSVSWCSATATQLWYDIPLCDRCKNNTAGEIMARIARDIARADDDGWMYVLEVKPVNGIPILKIGYSGYGNLNRRLNDLKKELGDIKVLSVEPGGRRREAAIHHHFRDFRLPGLGERFVDAAMVRDYVEAAGIDPSARNEFPGWAV